MPREMDPQLFAELDDLDSDFEIEARKQPSSWALLQKLVGEVEALKESSQKSALRISQVESRWEARLLESSKKTEKVTYALQRMEEFISQLKRDVSQMFHQLTGRVNERRISDARLEDLLERHNAVISQFEVQLMAAQKQLQDKDLQLLNYSQALKEIRVEMARMKGLSR